jgi:lipid-binding SYLF domain-containing protein
MLLTTVLVVIYGGPAMRGAPPSPGAPATVQAPDLGIAAAEITAIFSMERFGGFTFAAGDSLSNGPHLIGRSADGATGLDLAGDVRARHEISSLTLAGA